MAGRGTQYGAGNAGKAILCSALAALSIESRLNAHTVLMDCVQHRVALTVDRANIDVDVELIFGEWQSLLQRRQMDRNGDETITVEERAAYERFLAATLIKPLSVSVDGRRLDVIPLYDPAIELGGSNKTSLTGHRVRLSYFARTPSWIQSGSRITLSDGLWTKQPALSFLNVTGQDGVRLVIEDSGWTLSPQGTGGPRLMQTRCATAVGPAAPMVTDAGVASLGSPTTAEPDSPLAAHQQNPSGAVGRSAGPVFLCVAMAVLGVLAVFRPSAHIQQGEER